MDSKKEKKQWKKDDNNKLSYNEQKELKNIESKLKSLEFDKVQLEHKFNDHELSQDQVNNLSQQLQEIISDIETKEERWFELTTKLES